MRQPWTKEEWALIIGYYKAQHPNFDWAKVTDPMELPVSFGSLKESQIAVLPKDRHIRTEDRKAFCRRMLKHLKASEQKPAEAIEAPPAHQHTTTEEQTQPAAPTQAQARPQRIHYHEKDWDALASYLMRAFPNRDFTAAPITKPGLLAAIAATFPPDRRAKYPEMNYSRASLARAFVRLGAPGATLPEKPHITSSDFLPTHSSIIVRQPDGIDDGPPKGRVLWRTQELRSIAIELVCGNPALLDSTNSLRPADVFRAQKVLPTSRRRLNSATTTLTVRTMFAPILRSLRNEVNREKRELADREAMAKAAEAIAQRENEAAERAGREKEAAESIMKGMMDSPDVQNRILQKASIGQHIDHMLAKFMTMQAETLLGVLSSDKLKGALTINIHLPTNTPQDQAPRPPQEASTGTNAAHVEIKRIPTVAIVGALAQQGEVIRQSFPQIQVKLIDKNLQSNMLKDAVARCDKVFCMTDFVSHPVDGICAKAAGDKYQRVHGGVSSVRNAINAWLCTSLHH